MEPAKAADLVRKLRAKAASTTFPEEKKLLTQKADKLARKYRVDEKSFTYFSPAPGLFRPWDPGEGFGYYVRWRERVAPRPPAPTAAENGPFSGATGDIAS